MQKEVLCFFWIVFGSYWRTYHSIVNSLSYSTWSEIVSLILNWQVVTSNDQGDKHHWSYLDSQVTISLQNNFLFSKIHTTKEIMTDFISIHTQSKNVCLFFISFFLFLPNFLIPSLPKLNLKLQIFLHLCFYYFLNPSCVTLLYLFNIPTWATETMLSPWLAVDEARVSHVLSHIVWWKKTKPF